MLAAISQKHEQEIARLRAVISDHEKTIQSQQVRIQSLYEQFRLFQHARFGKKSEKSDDSQFQLNFVFDEEPPVEVVVAPSAEETQITYTRKKGRKKLPKELPFIEEIHDLPESEKQCACGCVLTHIGDDISETLDVVPQVIYRVKHIRRKYACKGCEETIRTTKLPKQAYPKSVTSPGLLAFIIDNKFNRHLPLYRQEQIFTQTKIPISRESMCKWMLKASEILNPLMKLLQAEVQGYDIAYADETPLQVLKEKKSAYMWLFSGGPPSKKAFVYQYHESRAHEVVYTFFEDFKGYIHADCYKAYVHLGKLPGITHIACFAHARRYFVEASKLSSNTGLAKRVVEATAKLYLLEKRFKEQGYSSEQIYQYRQEKALPILQEIKSMVDAQHSRVPPKSLLGKATHYLLNHWDALLGYLRDGRLEIDNNHSERAIKPFVIGRKNWLFHGNEAGAKAGCVMYSFIETCKAHNIDVFSWFKYVFTNIHLATTLEQLEALLPYNIDTTLLDGMRAIPKLQTEQT